MSVEMRSRPWKPAWPSLVWNTSASRTAGQLGPDAQRAHAADAEQQLLQEAVLAAAAVEAVGDVAERVLVLGDVGVEQQQRHAADRDLPDPRVQRAAVRQRERDERRGAVRVPGERQRQAVGVEDRVRLLLPAVRGDRLLEVAGAVEEADAGERQAEVGGALQVVAGEDAEAARVLRQRRGDAELRREVGDVRRGVGERLVPARLAAVGREVVAERVRARDERRRRRRAPRCAPGSPHRAARPGRTRSPPRSRGRSPRTAAGSARARTSGGWRRARPAPTATSAGRFGR